MSSQWNGGLGESGSRYEGTLGEANLQVRR